MKSPVHQAQAHPGSRATGGFSLVELLVAMAVLTMIIGLLMQILNGTTAATKGSTAHMDADSQARMVFDRLADDLAAMPKRSDVDLVFSKVDGGGLRGGNDQLYFYSGVPGLFSASTASASQSPTSLIGYRVDASSNYQLQRMAKGMVWDRGATGVVNSMVCLTLSGTSFAPAPLSTLEGNASWQAIVTGSDADYSLFSQGVYRLEFCYYLKDGTYSNKPVISGTQFTNNLVAAAAPDSSCDSSSGYSAGSRWYDTTGKRGYICLNANPSGAVWRPLVLDDVSSIVVALAVLDLPSRKKAPDLLQAMEAFTDPSDADLAANPPKLMATTWQAAANAPTFASTAGIPQTVASHVRIYQRHFSISPQ